MYDLFAVESRNVMKISHENLNLFKSNEYEEYLKLKRKGYSGETIGCLAWIFLHLLIASIVSTIYTIISNTPNSDFNKIKLSFFAAFIIYVLPGYFVSLSVTALIGTGLNKMFDFGNIFRHISQKRVSYRRLIELDLNFEGVKKDLKIQLNHYVADELSILIQKIKENRDNEVVFSKLTKILLLNHKFVKESSDILKTNNIFVNYKERLRRDDIWFEDELREAEELLRRKTQNEKLQEQTKVYSRKQTSKRCFNFNSLEVKQKG